MKPILRVIVDLLDPVAKWLEQWEKPQRVDQLWFIIQTLVYLASVATLLYLLSHTLWMALAGYALLSILYGLFRPAYLFMSDAFGLVHKTGHRVSSSWSEMMHDRIDRSERQSAWDFFLCSVRLSILWIFIVLPIADIELSNARSRHCSIAHQTC